MRVQYIETECGERIEVQEGHSNDDIFLSVMDIESGEEVITLLEQDELAELFDLLEEHRL